MPEPSKYAITATTVQITEQNYGTINGIQNTYESNPELTKAIADLKTLITDLQTQHPTATATQATTIIDAEFTEITQNKTHKRTSLRKQILNPDRHLQATKATLGEIAKHYLEESIWSKAIVTYIDKLSETPDTGA